MPELVPITNNFFVNLITRLGLKPPPGLGWMMQTQVVPVSIVDSDISIPAQMTTQTLGGAFSQGQIAAPGATILLADTGQLAAGVWNIIVSIGLGNVAGGSDFQIERRNAANAANIWVQLGGLNVTGPQAFVWSFTTTIVQNERIRVETLVGGAGSIQANIWANQVS